jgi:lipid II:glycine glycyltransferase (peptidoglycan interpeptide bridge formation enzyme)
MLRSKAEGATTYDFFGVAATEHPKHPWAGITRFKRGFGGRAERYIGSADAVFDPVRYRLLTIARGMRHLIHR